MKRPDIAIIGICITQAFLVFISWAACANGAPMPWLATLIAVAGPSLLVYSTANLSSEKKALWFATVGTVVCWAHLGPTAYFAIRYVMTFSGSYAPLIALIPNALLIWVSIWVVVAHARMRSSQKANKPPQV